MSSSPLNYVRQQQQSNKSNNNDNKNQRRNVIDVRFEIKSRSVDREFTTALQLPITAKIERSNSPPPPPLLLLLLLLLLLHEAHPVLQNDLMCFMWTKTITSIPLDNHYLYLDTQRTVFTSLASKILAWSPDRWKMNLISLKMNIISTNVL